MHLVLKAINYVAIASPYSAYTVLATSYLTAHFKKLSQNVRVDSYKVRHLNVNKYVANSFIKNYAVVSTF